MIGVASLLIALAVGLVVTRVGTVALRSTGLSQATAHFQARSAFTGVGFTTAESEDIVTHPARRSIVLTLMLLSSAGVVTTLGSLLLSFGGSPGLRQAGVRALAIAVGVIVLWRVSESAWVDRHLSRVIERVLARFTDLDARDYVRLLDIAGPYSISEIRVDPGDWLEGRSIEDLALGREGVVVLGVHHGDGTYEGVPTASLTLRAGDTLVAYGVSSSLEELEQRRSGRPGDEAHERATTTHRASLRDAASRAAHPIAAGPGRTRRGAAVRREG
ncbi:MAG: potassium transporter TrkA [Acidimicrobiales bacterium]|nr:potassium transporter TrkA [Acidimicrobiales bacterium]